MLGLVGQYEIFSILPFAEVKEILIIGFILVGVVTGFVGSLISADSKPISFQDSNHFRG